jgi:hypothetical protein
MAISGDYAYLADYGAGMRIVDVSDPESLTEAGHCTTPGSAWGVAVSGNYAFVADEDWGMRIIDVSNPESLTEVGHWQDTLTTASAEGIAASGNYAYLADWRAGLSILDVSNPQSPTEVWHYKDTLGGAALGVALSGNYAYVADGYQAGLRIIDVTNPQNPTEVGYYNTHDSARSVAVSGEYVYVGNSTTGLRIVEFLGTGAEEMGRQPTAGGSRPAAAVVRGGLHMPLTAGRLPFTAGLLDISGRKVLNLHPGANDVSRLGPGVYFVREETPHGGPIRRVVLVK